MEKIFLFGVDAPTTSFISKIAGNMRIKVSSVPFALYGSTLSDIISGTAVPADCENVPSKSLILFSDVTEKHFDNFLAKFRTSGYTVDFKAVVTATNRNWTVKRLFLAMEMETRI